MPEEIWIGLDISMQFRVTDEVALVQAAMASLFADPSIQAEERDMRAQQMGDPESGALAAASWLLRPGRLVQDVPGVEPEELGISGNIAGSQANSNGLPTCSEHLSMWEPESAPRRVRSSASLVCLSAAC
jgi:hypothetical protein